MTDELQPPKYRKYSDMDRQHEIQLNALGFIPHDSLDWPTPGTGYLVRLMGKLSEHVSECHPGRPELYHDLIPEISRLGRKLPKSMTDADVYGFLQTITVEAMKLIAKWRAVEPFIESAKPTRSPKADRTGKRHGKQPSPWLDAMQRRIGREARDEIADVLSAM